MLKNKSHIERLEAEIAEREKVIATCKTFIVDHADLHVRRVRRRAHLRLRRTKEASEAGEERKRFQMTRYEEDKILKAAWNKMTPAQQEKTRAQIETCNAAVAASNKALQEYNHATKVEDRAWKKLAKCYGVSLKLFVD